MQRAAPIALTIAGSDSGGGAGIQADLKTFAALGVYGATVVTAVTAQNTRAVTAVHTIPAQVVLDQIDAVFDDLDVRAVKIGMLSSPDVITAVAEGLTGRDIPIVVDPVMIAKSGDALLRPEAVRFLRERLLPMATVLTPNLPEAARLLGEVEAEHTLDLTGQASALIELGPDAVLMKGGHGTGRDCVDLLLVKDQPLMRFSAPRMATRNTHGTGCTLSAAIAAGLARGLDTPDAAAEAHDYLQGALRAADRLKVGTGHGPVHHFHALWPDE